MAEHPTYSTAPDAPPAVAFQTWTGPGETSVVLCEPCAKTPAEREFPLAAADLTRASKLGAIVCDRCDGLWTGEGWLRRGDVRELADGRIVSPEPLRPLSDLVADRGALVDGGVPYPWIDDGRSFDSDFGRKIAEWPMPYAPGLVASGATIDVAFEPRRIKCYLFAPELFEIIFAEGPHPYGYEVAEHPIPEGARIVASTYDAETGLMRVVFEHRSFEPVPSGGPIPQASVVVRRLVPPPPLEYGSVEINPGTVLVVRSTSELTWSDRDALRSGLEQLGLTGKVTVVSLRPGDELEALDEDAMRAAGWVRA